MCTAAEHGELIFAEVAAVLVSGGQGYVMQLAMCNAFLKASCPTLDLLATPCLFRSLSKALMDG